MVFIGEGDIMLASTLFFIGNIGVSGSLVFYDSLLPHVAKAGGNRSGVVGRLRDGLHQRRRPAAHQPRLDPAAARRSDSPTTVSAIRASFVAVAVWWAVFSIPLFLKVPEPPAGWDRSTAAWPSVAAFSRLAQTFREVRRYRHAFLLFIAMLLYQDGIQTIIRMAGVYGAEVGIDQNMQIAAFVMVQFVGIPFAFLFGSLGARHRHQALHLHRDRRLRRWRRSSPIS